ncbi:hypothetical protein ACTHO5_04670 [Cytobacillus praedii]|uniref:hypothetical protein n=1 Tax=Cytobacillus praedii TaxID=1742358 RepID=UPI003F7DF30B
MVYIVNNDLHIVTEKKMIGTSDTIIEILFPSTNDNDKIRQKAVCEQFGVKKFWILILLIFMSINLFLLFSNRTCGNLRKNEYRLSSPFLLHPH